MSFAANSGYSNSVESKRRVIDYLAQNGFSYGDIDQRVGRIDFVKKGRGLDGESILTEDFYVNVNTYQKPVIVTLESILKEDGEVLFNVKGAYKSNGQIIAKP